MSEHDTITSADDVKLTPWVHVGLLVVFLALAAAAHWMDKSDEYSLGLISKDTTVAYFLCGVFLAAAVYEFGVLAIQFTLRLRGGSPGEVTMLTRFMGVALALIVVIAFVLSIGPLGLNWTLVSVFLGLLFGWSLQAPLAGVAAWALVTIKRPFRIGDRVLFPANGLVGDVLDVGFMYTQLNQVGGSIGSEEASDRTILVPNAMLFSLVTINCTRTPYILDEIVFRLTYDSDWDAAEKIMLDAAREVTGDLIRQTGKEPYIRSDVWDYGIYMRLRYMTPARERPRMSYEITKKVVGEFQRNSRVDFAIPFVYSYRKSVQSGVRPSGAEAATEVAIESIDDPEANVPLRPADPNYIAELADKIKQLGLLQPVLVQRETNGRYTLMAGRFRLLACQRLGWNAIPAVVKEPESAPPEPPAQTPK